MDCIEATGLEQLRGIAAVVESGQFSLEMDGKRTRICPVGYQGTLSEVLGGIADQIEGEAKRDLTKDAREVVERLRGLYVDCGWQDVFDALFGITFSPTGAELRDRLCALIEHGGGQDVDVAALRELADDLESVEVDGVGTDYARGYELACGCAAALVRKAIEGAPEPDPCETIARGKAPGAAEAHAAVDAAQAVMPSAEGAGDESIGANVRQCERQAAADLVEKLGGVGVCAAAMVADLLRRQREPGSRTMGAR